MPAATTRESRPRPLHLRLHLHLRLRQPPVRPRGFSLVELLVVIGIIGLLAGLLLVALGGVRQRTKRAQSEATLQSFAQACEAFQIEHGFYPGVIPERVLAQAPGKLTTTENAVLHLMGGYRVLAPTDSPTDPDWQNFVYDEEITLGSGQDQWKLRVAFARIGEGPIVNGKPYAPYFTPQGSELKNALGQWTGSADESQLPDLIDGWGQPVLYLRRLRPRGVLVGNVANSADPPQFTISGLGGYLGSSKLGELGLNQIFQSASNRPGSILTITPTSDLDLNLGWIIEHPSLPGEPRGGFVLVSAGPDGIYYSATDGPGSTDTPVEDPGAQDLSKTLVDDYDDIRVFGGG